MVIFPAIPPPRPWYDAVWNTLAGTFQFLWNAAVAVATFFVAAVVWLANVAIGLTIGLVTGNWTYFETNVVEPLKRALEAFLSFVTNLLVSVLRPLLQPIVDGLRHWQRRMLVDAASFIHASWMRYHQSKTLGLAEAATAAGIVFGNDFLVAMALFSVIAAVIAVLFFVMPLISVVFGVAFGIALVAIAVEAGPGQFPRPIGVVPSPNVPSGLRPQFDSRYPDVAGVSLGELLDWFFFLGSVFLDMVGIVAGEIERIKGNPTFEVPAIALMLVLWVGGFALVVADYTPHLSVETRLWAYLFSALMSAISFYLAVAEMLLGEIEILKGVAFLPP